MDLRDEFWDGTFEGLEFMAKKGRMVRPSDTIDNCCVCNREVKNPKPNAQGYIYCRPCEEGDYSL